MKGLFFILCLLIMVGCHSQQAVKTSPPTPEAKLAQSVYFSYNSEEISNDAVIRANAQWLKSNTDKVVVLAGHCDERGDQEYNLLLGDRRARTVMKKLMEYGVSERQLIIMSYGKSRPVIKNHSEEGWALNRRVDFVLR